MVLTNGVTVQIFLYQASGLGEPQNKEYLYVIAQIFLYRACGLGLRLQNKEYLCAILGAALYCTYFYAP